MASEGRDHVTRARAAITARTRSLCADGTATAPTTGADRSGATGKTRTGRARGATSTRSACNQLPVWKRPVGARSGSAGRRT